MKKKALIVVRRNFVLQAQERNADVDAQVIQILSEVSDMHHAVMAGEQGADAARELYERALQMELTPGERASVQLDLAYLLDSRNIDREEAAYLYMQVLESGAEIQPNRRATAQLRFAWLLTVGVYSKKLQTAMQTHIPVR